MATRRLSFDLQELGLKGLGRIGLRQQTDTRKETWGRRLIANAMEICYVASGRQKVRIGNRTVGLNGHDVFVNHPGEWHSLADGLSERCRIFYLSFEVGRGSPVLMLPRQMSNVVRRSLTSLPQRFAGDVATGMLFDRSLTAAARVRGENGRFQVYAAILSLVSHVISMAEKDVRSPSHPPAVARVVHYVQTHLHEPLDVSALARVARLSNARFHALFKSEVGLPPREYVLRAKVDAAKCMLGTGPCDVLETALAMGFSSSQYFATVFRRYTGSSPTRFRAQSTATRDDS